MMKRFFRGLIIFVIVFMTGMITAEDTYSAANKANISNIHPDTNGVQQGDGIENRLSEIFYFSAASCSDCSAVQKFLEGLQESYLVNINGEEVWSKFSVTKFEIEDEDSLKLIKKLFDDYNVPDTDRRVPIIFLRNGYLSGNEDITNNLVDMVKKGQAIFSEKEKDRLLNLEGRVNSLSGYELPGVLVTGFLNGLNPCSISMLLFFISMLLVKSRNILRFGLAFIFGKFLTYLLLGTVLFNLLLDLDGLWFSNFQNTVRITLLVICLLLVYFNFVDFLSYKNERYSKIRLQLPASFREFNHKWMKRIQSVKGTGILTFFSFGLGTVVSVGEFLCTGQIYLATIVLMIRNNPVFDIKTVLYFILYGIALVIPLLILCIILHKGNELFEVSETIRTKMYIIKLANALIFLVFGILIFFQF